MHRDCGDRRVGDRLRGTLELERRWRQKFYLEGQKLHSKELGHSPSRHRTPGSSKAPEGFLRDRDWGSQMSEGPI